LRRLLYILFIDFKGPCLQLTALEMRIGIVFLGRRRFSPDYAINLKFQFDWFWKALIIKTWDSLIIIYYDSFDPYSLYIMLIINPKT